MPFWNTWNAASFGIGLEPEGLVAEIVDVDRWAGVSATEMVETMILCGDVQIDFEIFDGGERFSALPQAEEDIVGDLFGGAFLMDNGVAEPE